MAIIPMMINNDNNDDTLSEQCTLWANRTLLHLNATLTIMRQRKHLRDYPL